MLTVTMGARVRLSRKLARKQAGQDEAMRFTRKPGGWKLAVDRARPTDTAIVHEGKVVLLLDESASQAMADATLDIRHTSAGPRLKLS